MSNAIKTKKGLVEKSTGRKIKSPLDIAISQGILGMGPRVCDMPPSSLRKNMDKANKQSLVPKDVQPHSSRHGQALQEYRQPSSGNRILKDAGNREKYNRRTRNK